MRVAENDSNGVRARLLRAAHECFLADDYHSVTTRSIARMADANVSMIRYYFGSKQGLYEEMISETLSPLLEVLDGSMLSSSAGFSQFLLLYYETMSRTPQLPKLILKVLALKQGPGRQFIGQLLDRGRAKGARRVAALKSSGQIQMSADPDLIRIAFLSLAMGPMVFREIFQSQLGRPMDDAFIRELASFNGRLLSVALEPGMTTEFSPARMQPQRQDHR